MKAIEGFDLNDLDLFEGGFPHAAFADLRRESPVWWQPPSELAPGGEGFWAVVDHAHTRIVSMDPATYSSETGGDRQGGGTTLEDMPMDVVVGSMINMSDGERHARMRGLVSRAFTPRAIDRLESELRRRTRSILDEVTDAGACDFVVDVASELPMQVIADMLGMPEAERHRLFEAVTVLIRPADPKADPHARLQAGALLRSHGQQLIEAKRRQPDDSILSTVVHGAGGQQGLSQVELENFFMLLWIAGSDTTRNAISGSLIALCQRPGAAESLRGDPTLWPTAIEELLRFTSPVTYNRRTVTTPTELGGQKLAPGDKVAFWYPSANRDEQVFERPDELDLRRKPNPHLTFNIGAHVCLGANLARRELHAMTEELLARWKNIEVTGPVRYARSNKHGIIESVPIRFDRR